MGFVGGYVLHLYCDGPECPDKWRDMQGEVGTENTFSASARDAKEAGWFIDKNREGKNRGFALCPKCNTKANRKRLK